VRGPDVTSAHGWRNRGSMTCCGARPGCVAPPLGTAICARSWQVAVSCQPSTSGIDSRVSGQSTGVGSAVPRKKSCGFARVRSVYATCACGGGIVMRSVLLCEDHSGAQLLRLDHAWQLDHWPNILGRSLGAAARTVHSSWSCSNVWSMCDSRQSSSATCCSCTLSA
jgi:hypothetical protein